MTGRPGSVGADSVVSQRLRLHLDEHLFSPKGWFLLDADNVRVRPVASLRAGLGAVAAGEAATVAGTVRREVVVVDVDVDDEFRGLAVVEQFLAWATERDVWHLVRPSGGAPGRHHVYLVPGAYADDLVALVPDLRARHRVKGSLIDVRRGRSAVRPLSAPHRRGGNPAPLGALRERFATLLEVLPGSPVPLRGRSPRAVDAVSVATTVAEVSVRRVRRPVDPAWAKYLERGVIPDVDVDVEKRSTVELMATTALVRAGVDVHDAWQAVLGAEPGAMRKARERGRDWWVKHVWNTAVATDNAFLRSHASQAGPRQPVVDDATAADQAHARAAVQAARDATRVHQWSVPEKARAGFLLVVHTQLDRLAAAGELAAPCPERDLEVDTGLGRTAIRAHLHRAAELGLWELVDAFNPTQRATSSRIARLDSRFTPTSSSPLIAPPVFHTPHETDPPEMRPPPGLAAALPPGAHTLWRTLPQESEPVSSTKAGRSAGLTSGPFAEPSDTQRATIATHLYTLAAVGLAAQDDQGQWYRLDSPTEQLRAAAAATRAGLLRRVTAERARYRESGGNAAWVAQRDAAVARDVANGRAHFAALPPQEQQARRVAARARFFALSPVEQLHEKTRLVERRGRVAGEVHVEAVAHRDWCTTVGEDEYARRSVGGQAWYHTLAPPLQRAYVTMWQEHRQRHGIPRGYSGDPMAPTAGGSARESRTHARRGARETLRL